MIFANCRILLALLLCARPALGKTLKTVRGGYDLGVVLLDQDVQEVPVQGDPSLADFKPVLNALTASGNNPFTIQRSVTIAAHDQNPGPGDKAVMTEKPAASVDAAYLFGYLNISSGHTVAFKDVSLRRINAGVPFGHVSNSPGASLSFEDVIIHQEVCPPPEISQALLGIEKPRPDSGIAGQIIGLVAGKNDVEWDAAEQSLMMEDVTVKLPLTPAGFGGYTMRAVNSKIMCESTVPLPDECTGLAPLDTACLDAVWRDIKAELCSRRDCVNACKDVCAVKRRRHRRFKLKNIFSRRH